MPKNPRTGQLCRLLTSAAITAALVTSAAATAVPALAATPQSSRPAVVDSGFNPVNQDWNGDGISDLFAVNSSHQIFDYQGNGTTANGGFGATIPMGTTPAAAYPLMRGTNWYGNGKQNLLAIDEQGNLTSYPQAADGSIDYAHGQVMGTGWNQFQQVVSVNDFGGDGRPGLLAVSPEGTLWLYERNGNGWVNDHGIPIGSDFNNFYSLLPFQWTEGGPIGLLAEGFDGTLTFYATDGDGHWANGGVGQQIGFGFGPGGEFASPGSWAGHDSALLVEDAQGNLDAYYANGKGGWQNNGAATQVGTGWDQDWGLF